MGCFTSKMLWPKIREERTKELLEHKKSRINTITGVITGHCAVGLNLMRWGKTEDSYCRECGEEEETVTYLLCSCPALRSKRLSLLGQSSFMDLGEIGEISTGNIGRFAKSWKCFKKPLMK